ncbi:hypothetical protein NRIC_05530 [Enterococcus florum]|uniref:HTH araC/xylS-type domain-containing protein n=1 Tax=Enterococcus florum TaxID=2480627 RepID=A0A4P5PB47_9ENTE|nr:AraC family transcriptional regulator [Enterococcus florum]GCF92662.1 hypothetical protein NRIC_05530 [Enterococcus florum]
MVDNQSKDVRSFFSSLLIGEIKQTFDVSYLTNEFIANALEEEAIANSHISRNTLPESLKLEHSRFYTYTNIPEFAAVKPLRTTVVDIPASGIFIHSDTPVYLILYTISGKGKVTFKEQTISLGTNEGTIINCQNYHKYFATSEDAWRTIMIRATGEMVSHIYKQMMQESYFKFSFFDSGHFRSLLRELLYPAAEGANAISMNAIFTVTELLCEIGLEIDKKRRKQHVVPRYIKEIQHYIEQHYQQNITLDFLSQQFNFSKYHLSREFKKYIGQPPIDYLIEHRIQIAKELLVTTKLSIDEISQEIGIANASHFFYLFNKKEHTSPSKFRNTLPKIMDSK